MNIQKRICVINDISCLGRCSLTAALPIYAAAGIHGNVIPTALLSTQTGGYEGYTYRDLSEDMINIARHFQKLELEFDVMYTGYLTSEKQIDTVIETADMLQAKTLIVDPVMGDGGELYDGFTKSYCEKMKSLCKKADIIVPNLTEACFLTDREYRCVDENAVEEIVAGLRELGPKKMVVTGLRKADTKDIPEIGIAAVDENEIRTEFFRELEGVFHGAGDVFGAAFACGIAKGTDLVNSAEFAHSFTYRAIEITAEDRTDTRQGLNFEKCLGMVLEKYNR